MRDRDQDTITLPKLKVNARSAHQETSPVSSHSEEVRARRSVRYQPAASKPGQRQTAQKPMPSARYAVPTRPVVIRGSASSLPLQKPIKSSTKRRYHIALNTPGAEMRLPSISFGRPGWRILSGMVIIAMIAALYALTNLSEFKFNGAEVTGIQRVSLTDVEAVLKTDGIPAFAVKPQDLAANLQAAFPEFSSVSVNVGIPATLSVAVVERQPVILWKQGDTTFWIDKDGFSFPSHGDPGTTLVTVQANGNPPDPSASTSATPVAGTDSSTAATALPPATAPAAKPFISPELVAAIVSLSPMAPNATPIIYDPVHGLGWVDPNGWQVYFGTSLTDLTMKLQVYYAIVTQLSKQGIIPVMISVEFPHAPFYRTEK